MDGKPVHYVRNINQETRAVYGMMVHDSAVMRRSRTTATTWIRRTPPFGLKGR
jgi:hypothetical protein